MIVLTTSDYSGLDPLFIKPKSGSKFYSMNRRVKRSPTLTGGGFVVDFGFTDVDRTISIICSLSESDFIKLKTMHTAYSEHVLSCEDGLFAGVISKILDGGLGSVTLTYLVSERLV